MVFLVGGLRRKRVSYAQTNEKEGVSWNEQKQTWGMGRVKNQYSANAGKTNCAWMYEKGEGGEGGSRLNQKNWEHTFWMAPKLKYILKNCLS